jgi:hypothetical protein
MSMPTRHRNHVIGDIAVNAVMSIIGQCGWACEVVHKDYGEDLMVQPDLGGNLDPWRLWVQVKGTDHLREKSKTSNQYFIDLPLTQTRRWALGSDPTIVVLWHVAGNMGYWTYGPTLKEIIEATGKKQKNIRVVFEKEGVFNEEQLHQLVWESRIYHFNNLVASVHSQVELHGKENGDFENDLFLLCLEIMKYLGILDGAILTKGFHEFLFSKILPQYKNVKHDNDDVFLGMGMMGFLQWVSMKSNCGVPGPLLIHCGRYLATVIEITIEKVIERDKLRKEV